MLDYRMQTFLILCETMNYREAAQRLHITQPAVTQQIKYIEDYYGCKLFLYDGRTLSKTEQGKILERNVQSMNLQEKKLKSELLPKSGNYLSIGATKTIGEFVITEQIAGYLSDKNNYLKIDVDNTVNILAGLDRGEYDFALIEGLFNRSIYESRLYRREPFVGLCSKKHEFAGKTVSLGELFGENILLREEGSGTREIFQRFLEERSYSIEDFKRVTVVGNFGLLRQLVAGNCGITFAYDAVAGNDSNLKRFFIEEWEAYREFNYVYLPHTGAERAIKLFESY